MTIDHERTAPDDDMPAEDESFDRNDDDVVDIEDLDRDDTDEPDEPDETTDDVLDVDDLDTDEADETDEDRDVETTTEDFGETADVEEIDSTYADADEDLDETGELADLDTGTDSDDDLDTSTDSDDDLDTVDTGADSDEELAAVDAVETGDTVHGDEVEADPVADAAQGYFERTDAGETPDVTDVPDVPEPLEAPEDTPVAAEPAAAGLATDGPFLTDTAAFQQRWDGIQIGFVDEPLDAVENAGDLVAEVLDELTNALAARREELESRWRGTADISTEDLRVVFQDYRALFKRIVL